jgi:leucyl-tRNA synthetase
MGLVSFDEPFTKLFNQGMLHGADGNKMSKSLGNVVNPLDVIKQFSADSLRFNLMSLSAPNSDSIWSDRGMESAYKFLQRLFEVGMSIKIGSSSKRVASKVNKAVKEITPDIEGFRYNLAIIKFRELFDVISSESEIGKEEFGKFLKLLHPFCPHLTEELWHAKCAKSLISLEPWPTVDESKVDSSLEQTESTVNTLRLDILRIKDLAKLEKISKVKIFIAPKWKWRGLAIVKSACNAKPDFGAAIKAVMADNELKSKGADVPAFVKTAVAKLNELSQVNEFDEYAAIVQAKPALEKEFGSIEVIKAEESTESKAKNAFPTKPALLVE